MKKLIVLFIVVMGGAAGAAECNLDKGQKTFANKCGICHVSALGVAHTVGPNLHGIYGREPGKAAGFSYSEALAAKQGAWDETRLDAFLTSPNTAVPGTAMPFQGLKSAPERQNLICFLQTLK
ncbi:MAG: c-type cytochrome [Azonexaceae bacterium]|nr:c-type cytochrome [Azonexaceae bacterium]